MIKKNNLLAGTAFMALVLVLVVGMSFISCEQVSDPDFAVSKNKVLVPDVWPPVNLRDSTWQDLDIAGDPYYITDTWTFDAEKITYFVDWGTPPPWGWEGTIKHIEGLGLNASGGERGILFVYYEDSDLLWDTVGTENGRYSFMYYEQVSPLDPDAYHLLNPATDYSEGTYHPYGTPVYGDYTDAWDDFNSFTTPDLAIAHFFGFVDWPEYTKVAP